MALFIEKLNLVQDHPSGTAMGLPAEAIGPMFLGLGLLLLVSLLGMTLIVLYTLYRRCQRHRRRTYDLTEAASMATDVTEDCGSETLPDDSVIVFKSNACQQEEFNGED